MNLIFPSVYRINSYFLMLIRKMSLFVRLDEVLRISLSEWLLECDVELSLVSVFNYVFLRLRRLLSLFMTRYGTELILKVMGK